MTDLLPQLSSEGARNTFTRYQMRLRFRDKLLGGIPKNGKLIEGWLRAKAGVDGDDLRQMMLRTLIELGAEVSPDMSFEQLEEASERLAAVKSTNGFKRDETGMYIEDRQVKAAIKECVSILFAGARWGATRKGPMKFTAERVFVSPAHLYLYKADGTAFTEPENVELHIVHTSGPSGPIHALSYSEFVTAPEIEFTVISAHDEVKLEDWVEVWTLMQENGIGASRSQSYGRFDIIKWEKQDAPKKAKVA